MALKMHFSPAVHAGLWLKEDILRPNKIIMGGLADRLCVSRQTLSVILNGRAAISARLAGAFRKGTEHPGRNSFDNAGSF